VHKEMEAIGATAPSTYYVLVGSSLRKSWWGTCRADALLCAPSSYRCQREPFCSI